MSLRSWAGEKFRQWGNALAPPAPEPEPIRKDLSDFAGLAVAEQHGRNSRAEWTRNRREYVSSYKNSVYIAVGAIARKIAMQEALVSFEVPSKSGVSLEPAPPTHRLRELFREVNPIDTQYDLWYGMVGWRLTTGDSFLWKARNGLGGINEFWPLPSHWVWAIPSETEFISDYLVQGVFGKEATIPAADIVHIREPSLDWSGSGRFYGYPQLAAGASMVDIENAMFERLLAEFKNWAPPGGVFETEQQLTDDQVTQFYRQLAAQHALATRSGRPIVPHSGFKYREMKQREISYQKSFDLAMEHTLAIYGVPKAIVGLVKDTNRANMQASMESFCQHTINPLLVHFGQHLTQSMRGEFEDNIVVHFQPCTVDDVEQMRKNVDTAHRAGAVTQNDIREVLLDLPPYEVGGNRPFVQGSLVPAPFGNGPQSEFEADEEEPGGAEEDTEKRADSAIDALLDVDGNGRAVAGREVPAGFFHRLRRTPTNGHSETNGSAVP